MANRTIKEATSIRGTNPQYLIEKIIRNRIYDCRYWKEDCFGLTAELLVDKAMALDHIGGTFAQNVQTTPFICLVLKMLQIQPSKDIIVEFIRRSDYKYVRALGAYYMRLVGTSVDIYKYLEPLYIDYRKMKLKNIDGKFVLTHMDEYIHELLKEERVFSIVLPRLQKRWVLEESELIPTRLCALEDDITEEGNTTSESGNDSDTNSGKNVETRPSELNKYRSRSEDKYRRRCDMSPCRHTREYSSRHRHKHALTPHRRQSERKRVRSRSISPSHTSLHTRDRREYAPTSRREKYSKKDQEQNSNKMGESGRYYSKEELEDIKQQNELRKSLGMNPLKL